MHKIKFKWRGIDREIELKANDAYIAIKVLENVGYRVVETREKLYGRFERVYILEEINNGK